MQWNAFNYISIFIWVKIVWKSCSFKNWLNSDRKYVKHIYHNNNIWLHRRLWPQIYCIDTCQMLTWLEWPRFILAKSNISLTKELADWTLFNPTPGICRIGKISTVQNKLVNKPPACTSTKDLDAGMRETNTICVAHRAPTDPFFWYNQNINWTFLQSALLCFEHRLS